MDTLGRLRGQVKIRRSPMCWGHARSRPRTYVLMILRKLYPIRAKLRGLLLIPFRKQHYSWAPGQGPAQDQKMSLHGKPRIGKTRRNTAFRKQPCSWATEQEMRKIAPKMYCILTCGSIYRSKTMNSSSILSEL